MSVFKLASSIAHTKLSSRYYDTYDDDDMYEEPSTFKKSLPAILAGTAIGYGIINPLMNRNSIVNSYIAANPLTTSVPEYISDTRNSQMLKSFTDLPINTLKNISGAILGNSGPRAAHIASLVSNPALLGAAAGYAMYNYAPWVKKFGKMYAKQQLPWQAGFNVLNSKKLFTTPEADAEEELRQKRSRRY